ncbi:MAG: hypothetical protein ACK8QZ_05230, partial [Anaerolineales bacterium]
MIVPLSILADVSCSRARAYLLENLDDAQADCFPQKDIASERIFKDAKLSTVVFSGARSPLKAMESQLIHVRTFPGRSFDDAPRAATVRYRDMAMLDSKNLPVPLVSEEQLELCRVVHSHPKVVSFRDAPWIKITRGEINQTTFKKFISRDESYSKLLKGV